MPLESGEALEVMYKDGYADLDVVAGDTDCAHDLSDAMLLPGKDMFDC